MPKVEMRRILCPTDFSDCSRRALEHAIPLARWYGATITALHVLPLLPAMAAAFPAYVDPVSMEPIPRAQFLDRLRSFVADAEEAGVLAEVLLLEGHVTRTIVEQARSMEADLVVIGTHGREGFERLALGSVAEKVLRKATCPVLTVGPAPAHGAGAGPLFDRILCPVDFSPTSERALGYALSLAEEAKATLDLVHVVEWGMEEEYRGGRHFDLPEYRRFLVDDAYRRLRDIVPAEARDWCQVEEVVACGKPYREILRLAGEKNAQLVVMGVRGRGPLDVALFGSTTNHVVRAAECPVLTVREA